MFNQAGFVVKHVIYSNLTKIYEWFWIKFDTLFLPKYTLVDKNKIINLLNDTQNKWMVLNICNLILYFWQNAVCDHQLTCLLQLQIVKIQWS